MEVLLRVYACCFVEADTKSRFETYSIAIQNGVMSPNEVRSKENMDEVDGLNVYLLPLNHVQKGPDADVQVDSSNAFGADNPAQAALVVHRAL